MRIGKIMQKKDVMEILKKHKQEVQKKIDKLRGRIDLLEREKVVKGGKK